MTASTYSPSLRIELIPNGEQSGTWGTTTNLNLGTLLEDSIAGYVSVIASAASPGLLKYPLSTNNGAVDEARMAIVSLATDGTINAAYEVYIPPVSKTYTMRNAAAHPVTIFVSTVDGNIIPKGTGLVIPAGRTVQLWTDGTNVHNSLTHVSGDLSLGTPLAVSSGGTGLSAPNGVLVGANGEVTAVQPGIAGNILQSDGSRWIASTAGAGSVAGGTLYETNSTLTVPFALTSGKNAMTVGPFIIAGGGSLSIPPGQRFVII